MKRPSKDTIIYTAGILDGEGSIQINARRKERGKKNIYWYGTVQITSSCKQVLTELASSWDIGRITSWKPRGSRKNRASHNWRFYGQDSGKFLKTVLPYLRIKKENAALYIEFIKFTGYKRNALTKEIAHKRLGIALKLMKINERYGKGLKKYRSFKDVM